MNEKLENLVLDIKDEQDKTYYGLKSGRYWKILSNLKLTVGEVIIYYPIDKGQLQKISDCLPVLRSLIDNLNSEVENSKHSFFGFFNLGELREERDTLIKIYNLFLRSKDVIEKVYNDGQ